VRVIFNCSLCRLFAVVLTLSLFAVYLPLVSCTSGAAAAKNAGPAEPEVVELTPEELRMELVKSYNFGQQYYQQGNYTAALPYLHTAKNIDKKLNGDNILYPGIYQKIGRSYSELKMPDSSLVIYEEGLKYDPDNLHMNEMIAYYYKASNRIDQFIPAAIKVIGLSDEQEKKIEYMVQLKEVYVQRDEYDLALELMDQLVEMKPQNKDYIDERLSILRLSGGEGALRKEFEEKHQQFPNDKNYILELISIYERDNENQLLVEMADKLIALEPNEIDSREKKVNALITLNKNNDAIAVLNELNKLVPDQPRYLARVAEIYNDTGRYRNAVNYANRALRINNSYGEAHFQIGMAFMNQAEDVRDKRGSLAFEDKLVYQLAYDKFVIAARDINKKAQAERWVEHLVNFIPTSEDKFMHKGVTKPTSPEYDWLQGYFK